MMKNILKMFRGSYVINEGWEDGRKIIHYLLSDGRVAEVVLQPGRRNTGSVGDLATEAFN